MAGIGGDGNRISLPVGHGARAAGAQVILHVALAVVGFRIDVAFKLGEHLRDALADDIGQQRQPAAMRHADEHFAHVGGRPAPAAPR